MQRDKLEQLQAQVETGVADLVAGQDWQRWLTVAARFPRYSFRNQLLILAQRPDARAVMGYRAWQALGHQVRRGERSISILAPCTYKKKAKQVPHADSEAVDLEDEAEEDQPRRILRGFRVAHVFDISQTDGDQVRTPARPALLEGDAPVGLWDTLAAQINAAGYTLTRAAIPSGANGVTNFATRTVTIAEHLSAAQACKALAHELAHTAMHPNTPPAAAAAPKSKPKASPTSSATPPGSRPPPTVSATSPTGPAGTPPRSKPPPNGSSPPPAASSNGPDTSLNRLEPPKAWQRDANDGRPPARRWSTVNDPKPNSPITGSPSSRRQDAQ